VRGSAVAAKRPLGRSCSRRPLARLLRCAPPPPPAEAKSGLPATWRAQQGRPAAPRKLLPAAGQPQRFRLRHVAQLWPGPTRLRRRHRLSAEQIDSLRSASWPGVRAAETSSRGDIQAHQHCPTVRAVRGRVRRARTAIRIAALAAPARRSSRLANVYPGRHSPRSGTAAAHPCGAGNCDPDRTVRSQPPLVPGVDTLRIATDARRNLRHVPQFAQAPKLRSAPQLSQARRASTPPA
jgi:hypothetical protein